MRAKTWVEISQSALKDNVRALTGILPSDVRFCAIVKANAYGHGIAEIANLLLKDGVSFFGVDSVDEALTIRALSEDATIFVMGATVSERLEDVVRARAIQTVYDSAGLRAIKDTARHCGIPALITLEIETGLHRLGAGERELGTILEDLRYAAGFVYVVSVASHLASAEDAMLTEITGAQYQSFAHAVGVIEARGHTPEHIHIGCSAAGIMHEFPHGSQVRFGIAMYGLWPSPDVRRAGTLGKRHVELKPVLSWKTSIASVKDVEPGGRIGYGRSIPVNRLTRIAVLPVGYYDGFDRGLSAVGSVIIHGTRCPVLGKVCMNMIMVDVSTVPGVLSTQTPVTLLGRDGVQTIPADEIAEKLGTIHYEVVTRINPLLPRVIVR